MPTEDETRQLLAKAAATIAVNETTPMTLTGLPEPGHRRWSVLAAAAAVVVAIGGGALVAQQLGQDELTPMIEPGQSDLVPDEPSVVAVEDEDRMPGLIGYTEDEAIELLQERGYPVQVHVVPDGCDVPGIVTGTRPALGTPMAPGDPVTIRVVGQQDVIDCVGEVPWSLVWDVVRAARGLEEAPSLRDADFPGDVRTAVEEMVDALPDGEASELVAVWAFDPHPCWASGTDGVRFFVPSGPDDLVCPAVSVVVDFEVDRVKDVRIESMTIDEETLDGGLTRLSAAEQFVRWARGGPAPEFADRVRVMFGGGGAFGSNGWASSPEEPNSYGGCSGAGFPQCGINPVAVIYNHQGPVALTAGRSTCADGGEVPTRFADAPQDVVRLEEPEPASCRNAWAVELWIDEDGVIYGVNQAGG